MYLLSIRFYWNKLSVCVDNECLLSKCHFHRCVGVHDIIIGLGVAAQKALQRKGPMTGLLEKKGFYF